MTKEKIALIQVYIHHMKGVNVDIALRNQSDLALLELAFMSASRWANQNNVVLKFYDGAADTN
jgi:hypothetical protein